MSSTPHRMFGFFFLEKPKPITVGSRATNTMTLLSPPNANPESVNVMMLILLCFTSLIRGRNHLVNTFQAFFSNKGRVG